MFHFEFSFLSRLFSLVFLAMALGGLPACLGDADDHDNDIALSDDDHDDENPAAEACEHFESGPFVAVSAVSDVTDDAIGLVGNDHKDYQIALTENTATSDFGGFVAFESGEAVEYILFFKQDVEVVFWQSDAETEIEPAEVIDGDEHCADVAVQYHIDLPVGTVYLQLAAGDIETLDLVIEEVGGDEEHDDDDDHEE